MSNPSFQPSSLPTTRPSHMLANDQTALPVSFTLFLYAGLAGLLLTFVICIVRVFIRHFYLCNFKPNYNGAESGIEIIREADIEICDPDINHATVVRRASLNSDSYVVSAKGIDCSSVDENNPSTRCCSRSASALSIDSPHVSTTEINGTSSDSIDRDSSTPRGCCLFNRSNHAVPVSNGYPITGPTASIMNVMESVAEFPNFGKIMTFSFDPVNISCFSSNHVTFLNKLDCCP
jgi:hypothetical protein